MKLGGSCRCEDVLKLDAVRIGEEDGMVSGRIFRVFGRTVEHANAELQRLFMEAIDCGAVRAWKARWWRPGEPMSGKIWS